MRNKILIIFVMLSILLLSGCNNETDYYHGLLEECICSEGRNYSHYYWEFLPEGKCNCCAYISKMNKEGFYEKSTKCFGGETKWT